MKTSSIALTLGKKSSTISTIKGKIYKKLEIDNVLRLSEIMRRDGFNAAGNSKGIL